MEKPINTLSAHGNFNVVFGGQTTLLHIFAFMKACSYCGKQYPDDVEVCAIDQQPLGELKESRTEAVKPKVTCPECGAADDYSHLIELRSSYSLVSHLCGGLLAVILRNAGQPKKVRCNKCESHFHIQSHLSKLARVMYWLLVVPAIIVLVISLASIISSLFSH